MNKRGRRRSAALAESYNFLKDYQPVEYIESTGTQYINTGIIPDEWTGYEAILYLITFSYGYDPLFGADSSYFLQHWELNSRDGFYLRYGRAGAPFNIKQKQMITLRSLYNTDDGYIYADCNELSNRTPFQTFVNHPITIPAYIFTVNKGAVPTQLIKMKLYSFKMFNKKNKEIFHGIPVRRLSDNKSGLYDKVSQQFFTDANGGEFVLGGDIVL